MCSEINLLKHYPKSKRNLDERSEGKTDEVRSIARLFGKEFFDGDRKYGYGGFSYNPRFWQPVIPDIISHWSLNNKNSVLDVGCAKGFFLYDLQLAVPGITYKGIDISEYAIKNAVKEVKNNCLVADAKQLPFEDNFFDYVISINTVHNLDLNECSKALKEIQRVSKHNSFITVDAYETDKEKERMLKWNLTAKTILSKKKWIELFNEIGYKGDYYWFTP